MENPFAYYIIDELPPGVRGILVAGLFATAMGSLSTALNALATSFTEDWYIPYINPGATPERVVRAARISTVFFSVLLVVIGALTALAVLKIPDLRVIPIVLGIFGYTYGSLLGVFLAGMLTKTRGSNIGNIIAMIVGFIAVAILSGLHNTVWQIFLRQPRRFFGSRRGCRRSAFPGASPSAASSLSRSRSFSPLRPRNRKSPAPTSKKRREFSRSGFWPKRLESGFDAMMSFAE